MNNVAFTFNQESAAKAGGGDFVQDGGAYVCTIDSAKFIKANSGSSGLELAITTDSGMKANFLTMYYQKADGSQIKSGTSCINAIMYFLGLQNLTAQPMGGDHFAPELAGKQVGLFLQKTLYTKNDGSDGYKFDIRAPFNPTNKLTAKEAMDNKPAQSIDNWVASYKDKDDRNQQPVQNGGAFGAQPVNQFDQQGSDIPW